LRRLTAAGCGPAGPARTPLALQELMSMPLRFHHRRSIEYSRFGMIEPVRLTKVLDAPDCRAAAGCIADECHDALDYQPAYE
jgi:hypothetical protein